MSQLPSVASFLADNTEAQQKVYFQQLLEATAQLPGGSTAVDAGIVNGIISPANGQNTFMVDTEGQAASDILDNISVSNLPDGSIIMLVAKNAGRVVTVNHANGGSGQIITMLGKDFNLETDRFILLKLFGTSWYEFGGVPLEKATTAQAEAGTDDEAYMTALKTAQSIESRRGPTGWIPTTNSATVLSPGVTYTNDTGSPMLFSFGLSSGTGSARAYIDGAIVGETVYGGHYEYNGCGIVPVGGTYRIVLSGNGSIISTNRAW